MLWLRHLMPFVVLAVLGGGGTFAYHVASEQLDEWLRQKIIEELHKEDLHAEIGRLRLAPLSGAVVARKFRLYGGPGRQLLLGTFDELRLEIDPARLWQRQQFINHIDLRDAAVSLPVDPEDPQTNTIDLTGVDAHVRASGDRFEIRHAEGMISGIRVTLEGSLLRPSKIKQEKDRPPKDKKEALDFLKERRGFLELVFQQLGQLNYRPGLLPPHLQLRVEGDLDEPESLHVLARLKGENFAYGDYAISDVAATLEVVHGDLLLRELILRDAAGTLHGQGRFERGRRDIPFEFTSTANLPALVGAVRPLSVLNEFVLYEPGSLSISGEGTWTLPREGEDGTGSLQLLGSLSSGRFATRGAVFKSLHGEFYVRGHDLNFRQVKLEHESGTLEGQAMRLNDVWRYQAQLQMNPEALKPFITTDELRTLLDRFNFDEASTVEIDAKGVGRIDEPEKWTHEAQVDARQFRFENELVRRFSVKLNRTPGHAVLEDVRLSRSEGDVEVERLVVNEAEKTAHIVQLQANIFPLPVLRWISPKVAVELQGLKFQEPPRVEMSGRVGTENALPNDFVIDFIAGGLSHVSRKELMGRTLSVRNSVGRVTGQGVDLQIDVRGTLLAQTSWEETTLEEDMDGRFITHFSLEAGDEARNSWQLFLNGGAKANHVFDGVRLPVELQRVAVDYRPKRPRVTFPSIQTEVTGKIRGGARHRAFTALTDAETRFTGVFEVNPAPGHDRSRWTIAARCPGMVEYPLGGKNLPLQNVSFTAGFRDGRVQISDATAKVLGGAVSVLGEMETAAASRDYSLRLVAEDVSFGGLAELYSPGVDTGGKLSVTLQLAGKAIPEGPPPVGSGELALHDGDIFALPILGPLSPLIDAVLPGTKAGYSKARKASATFRIRDQKFTTEDFEALTGAFIIRGEGSVELDSRRVDLLARVNTRGPTGVLLFPVSKLLEYEAKGSTKEPGWKPRVLSLPSRLLSPE